MQLFIECCSSAFLSRNVPAVLIGAAEGLGHRHMGMHLTPVLENLMKFLLTSI